VRVEYYNQMQPIGVLNCRVELGRGRGAIGLKEVKF
jgi:hypothetical protein